MQIKPVLLLMTSTVFGISNYFAIPPQPVAQTIISAVEITASTSTPEKKVVSGKPKLLPELVPICACESTGRRDGTPTQFEKDGVTVKRGRINNNDIGMCQINIEPRNGHLVAAEKLGYDLFTEEGNINYANHLYKQSGSAPWEWSSSCWRNP